MLLYLKSLINRTKRHRNASPDTVGRVAPTRGIRDQVTATRSLLLGNDPLHRKLLVPQKLGIHALAGGVPLLLGLLDPVPVRLPRLVVRGMVLSKGERSKVRFVATGARKKACRAPATPQRRGGSARAGAGFRAKVWSRRPFGRGQRGRTTARTFRDRRIRSMHDIIGI